MFSGRVARAAAVGEGDRPGPVEERVRRRAAGVCHDGSIVRAMTTPSIQALPLAGERFTGDGATSRSSCGHRTTDRRSAPSRRAPPPTSTAPSRVAAKALRESPLPPWKRAEILDRAAVALAEQEEPSPGSSPTRRPSRSRPPASRRERAVGTFQFAAAEARTLAARWSRSTPSPPARASSASRCACRSASSARSPVQLPAQPRRPQARPGDRRRLPGGAEAGQPDAARRRSRSPRC